MDLHIKDKVFIVTGGGSGLGSGICRALASEGAIPVILDRNPLKDQYSREIHVIQPKTHFIRVSLNSEEECRGAVEETVSRFGIIDGLVNCAGANDDHTGLEDEPARFRQALENNLVHYFVMAHYCLPELKKSRGVILNISSSSAPTGPGNPSACPAFKGAQLSLTREWAATFLEDGIRVNAIVPAELRPALNDRRGQAYSDPQAKPGPTTPNIPRGRRMTTVREIADTAVFVLSPRSSQTTGQLLVVGRGYTHQDQASTATEK